MSRSDDRHYRPGVGMMLITPASGRIFIAQRLDSSDEAWQMPQGGIDPGEEPAATALRELREEIGTDKATILAESPEWMRYDLPESLRKKLWRGRYRGQRQKWFALRFDGEDSDIDIATAHPEFSTWRWEEATRVPELIVPFKRNLYRDVFSLFAPVLARFPGQT
ncbi:MAG: RNA pyrophosphohydrolase [Elsteraceae bacterium]